MAVSTVDIPPQRVQPFMRADNADPVGQMFGHARTTGDGTGGNHLLQFRLPQNNVYLIRWVRLGAVSGVAIVFDLSIGLGLVTDGATMAWRQTGLLPTDNTNVNLTIEPRRLMVLPDNDPRISGTIPNVSGQIFTMQFEAVFWSRQAFIDMDSEKFSRFL